MDTEKVEKARNGNVDEIGNLLMENMKSMYRVAFSILKTEEEISDSAGKRRKDRCIRTDGTQCGQRCRRH